MYTRREYNCLGFSFQYQLIFFFLIRSLFGSNRLSPLSVSFIFFQKGGIGYVSCCQLKFEILLKLKYSLILLQDLTLPLSNSFHYQIIGRQSSSLCHKNNQKKKKIFSIKLCLLSHRKFGIMQDGSSEKADKELLH